MSVTNETACDGMPEKVSPYLGIRQFNTYRNEPCTAAAAAAAATDECMFNSTKPTHVKELLRQG